MSRLGSMERVLRARKEYRCDSGYGCGRGVIAPGELYLYCTSPPWDDLWQTGTWDNIRVCGKCAPEKVAAEARTRVAA